MHKIKQHAKTESAYVFQIDVQSTKLLPRMSTSKSYYKTKINYHNQTIYNVGNKEAHNFWFSELDSTLEASTFVSIIIDFLQKNVIDRKSVFLISDGCAAQNRNAVLASELLRFSMEKKVFNDYIIFF
jgi:hypothetical protein